MRRWIAIVVGVACFGVLAAPARADYFVTHGLYSTPKAVGKRIFFVESDRDGAFVVRSTALDGSDPRRHRELDPIVRRKAPELVTDEIAFDASDRRLVVARGWTDPNATDIGPDADVSFEFSRVGIAAQGDRMRSLGGCLKGVRRPEGSTCPRRGTSSPISPTHATTPVRFLCGTSRAGEQRVRSVRRREGSGSTWRLRDRSWAAWPRTT